MSVEKRSDKKHFHVPTLRGLPHKAQEYPPAFCAEVIKGLKNQLRKDVSLYHKEKEVWALEILAQEDEEEEEDLDDALDKEMEKEEKKRMRGEEEPMHRITEEEKLSVMKLHRGLGHPQRSEFVRFMRAARVKEEVIRWAYKEFSCPAREAKQRPKATRLGIDLIFLPEVGAGKMFPALSMVD